MQQESVLQYSVSCSLITPIKMLGIGGYINEIVEKQPSIGNLESTKPPPINTCCRHKEAHKIIVAVTFVREVRSSSDLITR